MKKIKRIINILIAVMLVFITLSFAKYTTTLQSDKNVSVATGIINLNSVEENYLTVMSPIELNNNQELKFIVTNKFEDSKISDVSFKYRIIIEGLNDLPLKYSLYRFSVEENDYELLELYDNVTEDIITEPGVLSNVEYKLVISWNKDSDEYLDSKYSKTMDYIAVKVNSEQID